MAKGGARVRSGPAADPNSGRSDRARRAAKKTATSSSNSTSTSGQDETSAITSSEFNPLALPARGRGGNPPAYPLPKILRFVIDVSDGRPVKVPDGGAGDAFRKRELEIWRSVWKTPQAVAWEREPYRWPTIAEFCRMKAIVEAEPDSNAALVARLREYRNEIGLSPDGLRANGWAIAPDQLAEKRATRKSTKPAPAAALPPLRLQK